MICNELAMMLDKLLQILKLMFLGMVGEILSEE